MILSGTPKWTTWTKMQPNTFLCFALSNVLVLINLSWSLCIRVTFVPVLEYSDVIWHSSLTSNQTHQLERVQKRALRIILGTDYISYANALDVCDVDRLSARREQHSLKFAQSLPQCSRTSKLLPPCRGEIHGRQLRNNAKLTQPRARTNRYACSPIPYYVELINSKLP